VNDTGRVGGTRERNAAHTWIRHGRGACHGTVARQEMQHIHGNTRLQQEPHGLRRHQRSLLGGFREHGIACSKGCRHLPSENRQREIPGADAREDAAAVQAQLVALTSRPGRRTGAAKSCLALAA
jgi:hypothetical protein